MEMIIPFTFASLAVYRMAHLLVYDDGPFYIFKRLRLFFARRANMSRNELGIWNNLYDGITCPYCCGLYAAVICGILISFPTIYGSIFILIFAIAGAQSLIQRYTG